MDINILFFLVPCIFLVGSGYALVASVLERKVKFSGVKTGARVVKVYKAIPNGLGSFLPKKDGDFGCDYLLQLTYKNQAGKQVKISTSVRARMKVKNGKRFPYFAEGDTFLIRYSDRYPRCVVILLEQVEKRQGRMFPIVLWAFCSALLVAIIIAALVY